MATDKTGNTTLHGEPEPIGGLWAGQFEVIATIGSGDFIVPSRVTGSPAFNDCLFAIARVGTESNSQTPAACQCTGSKVEISIIGTGTISKYNAFDTSTTVAGTHTFFVIGKSGTATGGR